MGLTVPSIKPQQFWSAARLSLITSVNVCKCGRLSYGWFKSSSKIMSLTSVNGMHHSVLSPANLRLRSHKSWYQIHIPARVGKPLQKDAKWLCSVVVTPLQQIFCLIDLYKNVQFSKASLKESCFCLLYTSPSPRDLSTSRMPSSA